MKKRDESLNRNRAFLSIKNKTGSLHWKRARSWRDPRLNNYSVFVLPARRSDFTARRAMVADDFVESS